MKNILAILVALLQLLLSDVIIQIVFGSSLLWETSGSAGSDIILFVIEAYMGGLFLLTNLFILYESKIISTILILWLWGLLMLIVLSASILLAFIPGYAQEITLNNIAYEQQDFNIRTVITGFRSVWM